MVIMVDRKIAILKGEGTGKTLHLGRDLCSSSFVNPIKCPFSVLSKSVASEQIKSNVNLQLTDVLHDCSHPSAYTIN